MYHSIGKDCFCLCEAIFALFESRTPSCLVHFSRIKWVCLLFFTWEIMHNAFCIYMDELNKSKSEVALKEKHGSHWENVVICTRTLYGLSISMFWIYVVHVYYQRIMTAGPRFSVLIIGCRWYIGRQNSILDIIYRMIYHDNYEILEVMSDFFLIDKYTYQVHIITYLFKTS